MNISIENNKVISKKKNKNKNKNKNLLLKNYR